MISDSSRETPSIRPKKPLLTYIAFHPVTAFRQPGPGAEAERTIRADERMRCSKVISCIQRIPPFAVLVDLDTMLGCFGVEERGIMRSVQRF